MYTQEDSDAMKAVFLRFTMYFRWTRRKL